MKLLTVLPLQLSYFFSSRQNEYDADAYAVSIDCGRELREGLIKLGLFYKTIDISESGELISYDQRFFWERWKDTHPDTKKRIDKLDELIEVHELKSRLGNQN